MNKEMFKKQTREEREKALRGIINKKCDQLLTPKEINAVIDNLDVNMQYVIEVHKDFATFSERLHMWPAHRNNTVLPATVEVIYGKATSARYYTTKSNIDTQIFLGDEEKGKWQLANYPKIQLEAEHISVALRSEYTEYEFKKQAKNDSHEPTFGGNFVRTLLVYLPATIMHRKDRLNNRPRPVKQVEDVMVECDAANVDVSFTAEEINETPVQEVAVETCCETCDTSHEQDEEEPIEIDLA